MTRTDRIPFAAGVLATLVVLATLGGLLARPLPPRLEIAPPPVLVADDGMPNPEYKLPPRELAPDEVVILLDAGDVPDWGHAAIDVPAAWKFTKGKGAVVAVLDTGIDDGHRDFAGQIKASKDFTGSRSGSADVQGHGSHCAGVVAAAENGVGMVGVAPEAQILAGKVLGDSGSGLSTWIAAGIDWAVEQGADVISMSLGSPAADARIRDAIKRAVDKGVIVVAAAGNDGPREGTVGYPGGFPECICVAAVNDKGAVANFSSRGPRVDVAAPGVNVRSCYPGDRFATMSGTSMATPYVAGVAALYVADCKLRNEKPSPAAFRKLLTESAKDIAPAGKDTASGYGLVQPSKFLRGLPVPMPKDPPKEDADRVVIELPPELAGRKLRRIILDFEPVKP